MKIVITGASGTIGKKLVEALKNEGHVLLLVGRNTEKLDALFPQIANSDYQAFGSRCANFDSCIHLAVQNNQIEASKASFEAANVDLLKEVVSIAHNANIPQFINISTFLADTAQESVSGKDEYASTKRIGQDWLRESSPVPVMNIKVPAVYSEKLTGRLRFVSFLPRFLRSTALGILGSIKPIVNIDKVIGKIIQSVETRESGEVIVMDNIDNNRFYSITKRVIDLAFACMIVAIFWWLLLIVAAAIKLDSSGPIMFAQKRVGMNRKEFVCLKFRTMLVGTQQRGTHEIDGSSITKIGHMLRRSKIDELPQIINIFRGEMSLVGPRPCLASQSELIEARSNLNVFSILPGITGLSQVRNIDMSDPSSLSVSDAEYLYKRNLLMDLSTIFRTLAGSGQGDKVKR